MIDASTGSPGWTARIGGVRANASTMSRAELDEAETLDPGDPSGLAERYRELRALLPSLRVLGGCCGTNHRHIDAIALPVSWGPARPDENRSRLMSVVV